MSAFVLDTSGTIHFATLFAKAHGLLTFYRWSDLDAFTQGYVEAMFLTSGDPPGSFNGSENGEDDDLTAVRGFADLAPETLAAILKDCADYTSRPFGTKDITDLRPDSTAGGRFWRKRQERFYDAFPPLTPYLGDDGRVYLREGA